jgi:hypothetical protein
LQQLYLQIHHSLMESQMATSASEGEILWFCSVLCDLGVLNYFCIGCNAVDDCGHRRTQTSYDYLVSGF